jgi:hypothetical protein
MVSKLHEHEHGYEAAGELEHLLAGLERQKEELGPIAEELLAMLRRYGVETPELHDQLT